MNIADVIIHVNESLLPGAQTALEDALRELDGVVAPRFNKQTPHLLLVAYNPQKNNSQTMLQRVKADGYQAQLVGI